MPKGRVFAPDGLKDGNWFGHLGLPKCYSAPPNRELMTSTGIMLGAPYKPDNSHVPFPPPRSYLLRDSRNFKLANDFSEHNNRHLLQSTGEYFGDDMKCPMSSDQKDNKPNSGANNMNDEVDFSEFVWMGEENLEEFDRKVELELWEEQFIESCFNEMWRSEDQETVYFNESRSAMPPPVEAGPGTAYYPGAGAQRPPQPNHLYQRQPVQDEAEAADIAAMMDHLSVAERNGINQARSSKLNPDAAVFIPRSCNMTVTSTPTNVDR